MDISEYSDDEILNEFITRGLMSKGDYIWYISRQFPLSYEDMNDRLIKFCGSLQGGPGDKWNWKNDRLEKLNIDGLKYLYNLLSDK